MFSYLYLFLGRSDDNILGMYLHLQGYGLVDNLHIYIFHMHIDVGLFFARRIFHSKRRMNPWL